MVGIKKVAYSYSGDLVTTETITYRSGVKQITSYSYSNGLVTTESTTYTNGSYKRVRNYTNNGKVITGYTETIQNVWYKW